MVNQQETLILIKQKVKEFIPDARVFLFGSRTNNTATNESDWDVLIISQNPIDKNIKRIVQNALFPLSIQLSAFINTVMVSENDWNTNPSYYSLQQSISHQSIIE